MACAARRISTSWLATFSVFSLLYSPAQSAGPGHVLEDSLKYRTRPDIEAPRWNVTVYNRDLVSPGYWFVESYDYLDQSRENGGKWTAPHIFDADGGLIWSGSYLSEQYDTFDFRISNVLGEDMLTFLYPRNRTAVILDRHFNVYKTYTTASEEEDELDDMHELHFVDNGKRALFFYDKERNVSAAQSEAIGFTQWNCAVKENSIREIDLTKNWEVVFSWSSSDHINLTESTWTGAPVEERCTKPPKGWDFIHTNSLDKFPDDGSYLMSGRHTNTIYKIAPDGSITWRLGGMESDFEADFVFARQHHARIHEHNSTHTIMSLFDNAKAVDSEKTDTQMSRGLMIALRTDVRPMTATLLSEYRHPDGPGNFTLGRGSTQLLPNGNVFSGWVDACLHTEHATDGSLIMEARVKQFWLKSYRSYKFPFVGLPARPPDVSSAIFGADDDTSPTTMVHVSWNGATEVASWVLYKTDSTGNLKSAEHIASMPKTGFETVLTYPGYATYVVLEGLDRNGDVLGRSEVTTTNVESPLPDEVAVKEAQWLEGLRVKTDGGRARSWTVGSLFLLFAFGLASGIGIAAVWRSFTRANRVKGLRWWRPESTSSYEMDRHRVKGGEEEAQGLVNGHHVDDDDERS